MMILKNKKSYIATTPQTGDIVEIIKQLGLTVIDQGQKNARVELKYKNYQKMMLNLAYYTNTLAQNFCTESFICHAIQIHQFGKESSFTKENLYDTSLMIQQIFMNEFISQK